MANLRVRNHVDTYKLFSVVWVLGCLLYFRQWNNNAALASTLAVSTYCLMWQVKSKLFPDKNWEAEIPLPLAVLFIWVPLLLYLVAPTVMMQRGADMPPWLATLFLYSFIWGVFLHYVSDSHKHFVLKARPGLITDGLWSVSRNANYLGELLIYIAFVGIPASALRSVLPVLPLMYSVGRVWVPNMRKKDKSLSRYPEFAAWKKRSAFWVPFLW